MPDWRQKRDARSNQDQPGNQLGGQSIASGLAQVAPAQRSAGDRREDAEIESASQEHDHSDYGEGHAQRVADDQ
jgi:hypothetical protein